MRAAAKLVIAALGVSCSLAHAVVSATDARGVTVTLEVPAKRVISLSPHLTEDLFAIGAGAHVIGAMEYSDYPEAARRIPRVGAANALDLERIVALRPDLLVVWLHGNSEAQLARLRGFGIPMFHSEARRLADISRELRALGALTGETASAQAAADAFDARLRRLRERYAQRPPVKVFWQIWSEPLMTVNGQHLVSEVLRVCGGENAFATLPALAPAVTVESVVAVDPEAIVTVAEAGSSRSDLDRWRSMATLSAVAHGNLIELRTESIHRQSPRVLDGAEALCRALEEVRSRRR